MEKAAKLQQENNALKQQLSLINADYKKQLDNKDGRIRHLEEFIKILRQKQFGSSSEKESSPQLSLFNEAEEQSEEAENATPDEAPLIIAAHTRKKKPRVTIPAELPREEIIYDLPESEKFCPHDNTALKEIDSEIHEQIDIIPAQIKVLRHSRKKYCCPSCKKYIVTAKKPKQAIEKSIASASMLAYITSSKYIDGIPLYRQTELYKRINITISRTNMANWMIKCGELIQPLINLIQDKILEQRVVHMDETVLQVLNEPGREAQQKSYMWLLATFGKQPAVVFHYSPTRSGAQAKQLLAGYENALMTDGYAGYNQVTRDNKLVRLGCWAHARRKFNDAKKVQPKGKVGSPDQALAFIRKLYAIEKDTKEQSAEKRYKIRQEQSVPLLEKIKQWMQKKSAPPKSTLGKALTYLNNQWPELIRYCENGEYPIDNNLAENAIRPFVIGRKNWLFSNSQAGAKASANLYSLIETAKANGLNPYEYLRLVFTKLPNAENIEAIEELLPWRCAEKGVL